eukprot:10746720-Karenia_brevis.AAC.1
MKDASKKLNILVGRINKAARPELFDDLRQELQDTKSKVDVVGDLCSYLCMSAIPAEQCCKAFEACKQNNVTFSMAYEFEHLKQQAS